MRGTLTDSGPLYALIAHNDAYHSRAVQQVAAVALPLVTTWPCLTEAMHFLGKALGWRGRKALLSMAEQGDLIVLDSEHHPLSATAALMEEYADTPMDLADASLVASARKLGASDVFTFDEHFYADRTVRNRRFRVVPGPSD